MRVVHLGLNPYPVAHEPLLSGHFVGESVDVEPAALVSESKPASKEETPAFQCDGRVYCSDMRSRAEAEFFVKHCPGTKMDGDNDGEPC